MNIQTLKNVQRMILANMALDKKGSPATKSKAVAKKIVKTQKKKV